VVSLVKKIWKERRDHREGQRERERERERERLAQQIKMREMEEFKNSEKC